MALVDLVMPKMGESIMEATVLKWHKKPGDTVQQDETVLEIATDKVDTEVPSSAEGIIEEILFTIPLSFSGVSTNIVVSIVVALEIVGFALGSVLSSVLLLLCPQELNEAEISMYRNVIFIVTKCRLALPPTD